MCFKRIVFFFLFVVTSLCAQHIDQDFVVIDEWQFPEELVTGYIWDSEVDETGRLVIMFFRDGIKVISPTQVRNLASYGQGPGDIERWMALTLDGSYLIDVEASGKLKYYRYSETNYLYDKTEWLSIDNNFPAVRGAAKWSNKWYLVGFSLSDPLSQNTAGFFLSVYQEKKRPAKRLLFKDFKGVFRGPLLLTAHIRHASEAMWVMLESEPFLYQFSCSTDVLEKMISLPMPVFYRPIKDYWPFVRGPLSKIKIEYENWLLSYSRIENFRIADTHLIVQIRTSDEKKSKFALLFYRLTDFSLEKVYFTDDYFLTEKEGKYFFFRNGDPGLDENAKNINIRVYKKKS